MRIDDLNRTPLTQGTEKTDQAEVSQLAQALSTSDPARLEQLRLQVQSGTYEVNSGALAKSIINAHLKE